MSLVDRIQTNRLILREHTLQDFDALHAMWSEPAVYRHIIGRPSTREEAWNRLLRYSGHWALLGYGYWVLEERATGAYVGEMGFADYHRDIDPPLDGPARNGLGSQDCCPWQRLCNRSPAGDHRLGRCAFCREGNIRHDCPRKHRFNPPCRKNRLRQKTGNHLQGRTHARVLSRLSVLPTPSGGPSKATSGIQSLHFSRNASALSSRMSSITPASLSCSQSHQASAMIRALIFGSNRQRMNFAGTPATMA